MLDLHWLQMFCRAVAASLARTGSWEALNYINLEDLL